MRRIVRSAGFAFDGLYHAVATENNFRMFLIVYIAILIACAVLDINMLEWVAVLGSGGLFLCVELLNTSIERITDTLDEHRKKIPGAQAVHLGLKAAKDVGAAASLVSLFIFIAILLIVFYPRMAGVL